MLDRYKSLQVNDVTAERIRHNILDAMKDRTMEAEKLAQRERHRIQRLETERRKLLQAHLAGAIPLELLKEEQDRIASELANADGELLVDQTVTACLPVMEGHAAELQESISRAESENAPDIVLSYARSALVAAATSYQVLAALGRI